MAVNYVEIAIKAQNDASGALALLKEQLKSLSDKVAAVKVDMNDRMFQARYLRIMAGLQRLDRFVARPKVDVGGITRALAQLALLDTQFERLGGGGGGFLSRLFGGAAGAGGGIGGILGKIGGIQAGPLPVAGWAGIVAAIPLLAGALGGTLGIIPLLAAATLGVGAFGALAIPTFSKVTAAVTALGAATTKAQIAKAWAAVPPEIRPIVREFQALQGVWDSMSASLQPLVLQIAKVALDIGRNFLPSLLPLAKSAGGAIEVLLKAFDKFVTPGQVSRVHDTLTAVKAIGAMPPGTNAPSGFQQFMALLAKLSGPAIKAIGEGLGQVTIALGRLLTTLVNPRALAYLEQLFHFLAIGIDWLSNWVHWMTIAGDAVGRFIARAGPAIARFFSSDIPHWITVAENWFARLPGMILRALGNLAGLLVPGGKQLISGLISGIVSMLGPLRGVISTVLGVINSLTGLSLHLPGLPSSSHAGQAGGGPVVPPPVGGPHHLPQVSLAVQPGGSGLDQMFMTWLANGIRVRGGDPGILYRKVMFA